MKPVFKKYDQNQISLLPQSLEELIAAKHPVRVVSQVIDKINIDKLQETYKGGGNSSFNPRMMLKVLVYAYMTNVYSSRKIETLLQENINFMWLSGRQTPDHNTINRFRSQRLKETLKQIFTGIVVMLRDAGMLDIKEIFTDGTKIESKANRYTFVWGKGIKTRKEKMLNQIEEMWKYAEQVTSEELLDTRPACYEEVDAERVKQR